MSEMLFGFNPRGVIQDQTFALFQRYLGCSKKMPKRNDPVLHTFEKLQNVTIYFIIPDKLRSKTQEDTDRKLTSCKLSVKRLCSPLLIFLVYLIF